MTPSSNRRHFLGSTLAFGAGAAAWPFSRALGAPTKSTQSEPEGFFTLGRQKDHWWFIAPNGKPFFSLGVNHIDPATFPGDEEANALLDRPRRKGWELPKLT